MINIKQVICEVLDKVGVPYGFASKDEGEGQFIVFNTHMNKAYKFYDDEEKVTLHKVTINIFSAGDYTDLQNKLVEEMYKAGFSKDYFPACIYVENMAIYNQPLYFNYYEEGEY